MKPRILLVEDDPVSRVFLATAVEALPATVDAVDSCAAALRCAQEVNHDLWLIDANLPDGSGAGLLTLLRKHAPRTPALAHTASNERSGHDALIAAGFVEVLIKPISAAALQGAVCRLLGHDAVQTGAVLGHCVKLPQWDDAAALSALKGEQAHVVALRRLFLDELPGQCDSVASALATGDVPRATKALHMLRASCGFVGAARLGEAVRVLEADPQSAIGLQRFNDAATDLLDADRSVYAV